MITKFTAKHKHFGDCIVTKVASLNDYLSITPHLNPMDYGLESDGTLTYMDEYERDLREYHSDLETVSSSISTYGYVYLILCKDDVVRFDHFDDVFRNITHIQ